MAPLRVEGQVSQEIIRLPHERAYSPLRHARSTDFTALLPTQRLQERAGVEPNRRGKVEELQYVKAPIS
jgi:hypothetical protein